uniref:Retrovirus-related Pol polyprotein from transposon TNT 1-94 n=1 Tax=Cajanus cajan TaxID=3821 RepID=A0A151SFB5_CAJCA|nr:hypothetical protein KK1_024634 [Cajanus cajan]
MTSNQSLFSHLSFSTSLPSITLAIGSHGIEVAQSTFDIAISLWKYALDILIESGVVDCHPSDTLMDPNIKLLLGQGKPLGDLEGYINDPYDSHWTTVIRILKYIKKVSSCGLLYEDKGNSKIVYYFDANCVGSPFDRWSTSSYCVLIEGNLISWKLHGYNNFSNNSKLETNRTLQEMAKTFLCENSLPKHFQIEVVNMTCYIQNRILI